MENRMAHFDGVKFIATLIVFGSHTSAFMMYGQGSVAVALFYVLSGFFMVSPFRKDGEERFASVKGWMSYYVLKIVRIIPFYWICLVFFYWISDTAIIGKRALLENMFFYNTYGHIWYLQHLVVCYLFAPVLELIVYFAKKYLKANNLVIGCVLLVIGFVGGVKLEKTRSIYLLWAGVHRTLRCGIFVIGMGVGYIAKAMKNIEFKSKITYYTLDFAEIFLFLTLAIFSGSEFLSKFDEKYVNYHIGWTYPIRCSIIGVLLVLVVVLNKKGVVSKLLSTKPCVKCGRASLGIYLIHYFMLEFFRFVPVKSFVMLCIFVLPVGVLIYEKFEEPMYRYVKNKICK